MSGNDSLARYFDKTFGDLRNNNKPFFVEVREIC